MLNYFEYTEWITPLSLPAQFFHEDFEKINGRVYYDLSVAEFNNKYKGQLLDESPEDTHYWLKNQGVITDIAFVNDFEKIQLRRFPFLHVLKALRFAPFVLIAIFIFYTYKKEY